MYEPQLAVALNIDKLDKYLDYWWEPKLDGVRCIVSKQGDVVNLTSRGNKSFTEKLPHLVEMFKEIPDDFVLDGELGYYTDWDRTPIIDFNRTMRVIGSGIDEALRKQRTAEDYGTAHGSIGFFAFDMLVWGLDHYVEDQVSNLVRREMLAEWRNRWMMKGLLPADFFDLTDWFPPTQQFSPEWLMKYYTDYVDRGGEGMMLKNPNAVYYPGKRRANTWYKLKKFDTTTVTITGAIPGRGKYEDQIGALTFADSAGVTGKCSGMSDDQRMEFSLQLDIYIGKKMDIRYFGMVGKEDSGFRHPQFIRLRPDLD